MSRQDQQSNYTYTYHHVPFDPTWLDENGFITGVFKERAPDKHTEIWLGYQLCSKELAEQEILARTSNEAHPLPDWALREPNGLAWALHRIAERTAFRVNSHGNPPRPFEFEVRHGVAFQDLQLVIPSGEDGKSTTTINARATVWPHHVKVDLCDAAWRPVCSPGAEWIREYAPYYFYGKMEWQQLSRPRIDNEMRVFSVYDHCPAFLGEYLNRFLSEWKGSWTGLDDPTPLVRLDSEFRQEMTKLRHTNLGKQHMNWKGIRVTPTLELLYKLLVRGSDLDSEDVQPNLIMIGAALLSELGDLRRAFERGEPLDTVESLRKYTTDEGRLDAYAKSLELKLPEATGWAKDYIVQEYLPAFVERTWKQFL